MSHVENDENRGVGGRGNEVDRKKIPRVSSGMGEMKCEKWKGIGQRWRMKIVGNEHKTTTDIERETDEDGTGVRQHPVPVPLAKQRP